ncbi:MAG: DUF2802 domain-containing protein [Gammaproteobacteria bacterium]|nr:MAG: DUF2802 domain-containing protein [Gammaproteobacteria bacterium]
MGIDALLLLGFVLSAVSFLIGLWWLWRQIEGLRGMITALQQQVEENRGMLRAEGQALRRFEQQMKAAVITKPVGVKQSGQKTYRQAAKMLEMGASLDEIQQCCDLTRGELELLAQMSQAKMAAG